MRADIRSDLLALMSEASAAKSPEASKLLSLRSRIDFGHAKRIKAQVREDQGEHKHPEHTA